MKKYFIPTIVICIAIYNATAPSAATIDPITAGGANQRVVSVRSLAAGLTDPAVRASKLESLYNKEIDKTSDNMDFLSQTLASSSSDEKIVAARLLASLYTFGESSDWNAKVKQALRKSIDSTDAKVATNALLRYSRLGFFPDTVELLELHYKSGRLNENDLYGEFAHIFAFAPETQQLQLLEKIRKSKNAYALDIVSARIKDVEFTKTLTSSTRISLQTLLQSNQPRFSVAIGEFSLTEAVIFSDWLHALSLLSALNGTGEYDNVVLANLNGTTSNPKKAISFFSSPEGKAAAKRIGKAPLNETFERIRNFLKYQPSPRNETLQIFGNNVLALQNTLP